MFTLSTYIDYNRKLIPYSCVPTCSSGVSTGGGGGGGVWAANKICITNKLNLCCLIHQGTWTSTDIDSF